jgi:hypothetical protein
MSLITQSNHLIVTLPFLSVISSTVQSASVRSFEHINPVFHGEIGMVELQKCDLFFNMSLADIFPPSVDITSQPIVPSLSLTVHYPGWESLHNSIHLPPTALVDAPTITFTPHDPSTTPVLQTDPSIPPLYTLLVVDPDYPSKDVKGRSAGIAPVDGCVDLDVVVIARRIDVAGLGRNDARRGGAAQGYNRDGRVAVCGGAVPKLALRVFSPAPDGPVAEQRARVLITGRDSCGGAAQGDD